jgi:hypothetical protein
MKGMVGFQPMPTLPIFWLALAIWLSFGTMPKYWLAQRALDPAVHFSPTPGRAEGAQNARQKIGSPACQSVVQYN